MFNIFLPFIQHKTDNSSRYQCESDRNHEDDKDTIACGCTVTEFLSDRVGCCGYREFEVGFTQSCSENGFIHKLRVESCHILGNQVDKVCHLELLSLIVSFIDKVRTESGGLIAAYKSLIENILIILIQHSILSTLSSCSINRRIVFVSSLETVLIVGQIGHQLIWLDVISCT